MPWKEESRVDLREQFIKAWLERSHSVADLCRGFGISRKTGYKFIGRFRREGLPGLADRSRRPHHPPAMVSREVADAILAMRRRHPGEGAQKLLERLRRRHPQMALPAASTAHEIIRRNGLVVARRRRRRATPAPAGTLTTPGSPNHVLSVDFKGWFRLGNGQRCHALTVSDNYSRFLLRCVALGDGETRFEQVQAILMACFLEYGLPTVILTDNGPPFASTGLGGLTMLSVWFIRLGIRHERIEPGKPQQNGRHERMHGTLKRAVCRRPAHDLRAQQAAFDRFRADYNHERPHHALQMRTPAELYTPSPRKMPPWLPDIVYPQHMLVRKAKGSGQIKLDGHEIRIGAALVGQRLGLRFEDDERHVSVFLDDIVLGTIDLGEPKRKFTPRKGGSGGGGGGGGGRAPRPPPPPPPG